MLFNSLEFFLFFAVVYGLYLILDRPWQNKMLILASCLFYAAWNWKFLALMFVSITTDYFCSNKIFTSSDQKTKKKFLFLSIFVNLGILGFFKYFNFFVGSFKALFLHFFPSWAPSFDWTWSIILPVGISFYTFEAISYTVDVYRGIIPPAKNYWDYVLFVIYFPHLVAGPIMRAKDFLWQITSKRVVTWDKFYEGCFLIFWGLFEKMFVADNLAKIVNPVFAPGASVDGQTVLLAVYSFAFQIFCDFDGYSNMARGLGKCMGFEITINFKLPYFSSNPVEFWRRWHISLSSWLRDYLYIPLGGNRGSQANMYKNLFLTMLLGGLWHGAAWTFIVWGAYHGILLIAYRLKNGNSKTPPLDESPKSIFSIVIFFHLVVLGWLFFRASSLTQAFDMIHHLLWNFNLRPDHTMLWLKFLGILTPLWIVQIFQYRTKDLMILYRQPWIVKTVVYAFMTYLIIGWGIMKAEEFIYFQF